MGRDKRRIAKIIGAGFAALAGGLIILAFGYLLGNSGGYYDAQADSRAEQIGEAADRRIESCLRQSDTTVLATRQCVEQAVRSAREQQRAEQDLSAQRQMAQWAWWLLVVTAFGMPLTALGLVLLLQTIWQGREAITESRRIGQAQVRCYLTATRASLRLSQDGFIDVSVSLHNSGQSPASRIEVSYMATLSALAYPRIHAGVQVNSSNLSNYAVAAGKEVDIPPQTCSEPISPEMLRILREEEPKALSCIIFLEFNWLDVFETKLRMVEGFHALHEGVIFDEDIPLESGDFMIAKIRSDHLRGKFKDWE